MRWEWLLVLPNIPGCPICSPSGCGYADRSNNSVLSNLGTPFYLSPTTTKESISAKLDMFRSHKSAVGGFTALVTNIVSLQQLSPSQTVELFKNNMISVLVSNPEELDNLKKIANQAAVTVVIPASKVKDASFEKKLDDFIQYSHSTKKSIPDAEWEKIAKG